MLKGNILKVHLLVFHEFNNLAKFSANFLWVGKEGSLSMALMRNECSLLSTSKACGEF